MVESSARQATHQEPAWRDRSNFIIAAEIDPGDTDITSEQLWARKITDTEFEICCIPFFVYDLALGDIVRTAAEGNKQYIVDEVIRGSGHFTFRVPLSQSNLSRADLAARLVEMGALTERSSKTMLAVDSPNAEHAQRIADFLHSEEQAGRLIYETGRTA